MHLSKLFLAGLSFIALAVSLPVHTTGSSTDLIDRAGEVDVRSVSLAVHDSLSLFARMFGEDDESYLQRREDAQCVACLESDANVKYTNCPKGHPGHMDCIMEWMKAQTEQKLKMTCPACRTPTSPLIKPIKKGASAAKAKPGGKKAGKKGKRDLEEVESEAEAEMRDLDEEHPELGSEA